MSNELAVVNADAQAIPYGDIERMAKAMAASKLFGLTSPEQAIALMIVAQAEGLHPGTIARDYHIINGKASMKADTMLARFLAAGGSVEWLEYTDARVAARFSCPSSGSVEVDWDNKRCQQAGLTGGNHSKYPRQMKRSRCISEGVRTCNPGVLNGMYCPEEVADFTPQTPADMPGADDRPTRWQGGERHDSRVVDAEVLPPAVLPTGVTIAAHVSDIALRTSGKRQYYGMHVLYNDIDRVAICWHTGSMLQDALRLDTDKLPGASGDVLLELSSAEDARGGLIYTVEAMAAVEAPMDADIGNPFCGGTGPASAGWNQ